MNIPTLTTHGSANQGKDAAPLGEKNPTLEIRGSYSTPLAGLLKDRYLQIKPTLKRPILFVIINTVKLILNHELSNIQGPP